MQQKQSKFHYFSGKGGVGKTSMASATAVYFVDRGERTLIITTDPASNLADVFEQEIGHKIAQICGIDNLWAMEIDADAATAEYKENALVPLRELFPEEMLKVFEEQLNSPCTEEMAAFDKFIEFTSLCDYEVIVFDTASTGHTLRLLELPVDWSKQLELRAAGTVISDEFNKQARERFGRVIERMRTPEKTTFAFVVYPEQTPIVEAWRAAQDLKEIGILTKLVVANFVLPEEQCTTDFFRKRFEM